MSGLLEALRDVTSEPVGVVVVASPVVALGLATAALATSGRPAGRPAALGSLVALGVGALAAWAEVLVARARFVSYVLHPERAAIPAKAGFAAAMEFGRWVTAQACGAAAFVVVAPVVAVACALAWSRRASSTIERCRAWVVTTGLAAPMVSTAAALACSADALAKTHGHVGFEEKYARLLAAFDVLDATRPWTLVVAVTFGVAAITCACLGPAPRRGMRWGGLALGLAGLVAFAATRARAWDAAHPIPAVTGAPWTDGDAVLPLVPECAAASDSAPTVTVRAGDRLEVDGVAARDLPELEVVMQAKRMVAGRSWSGRFTLAAAVDADREAVAAVVRACARAGAPHPAWLATRPTPAVDSATLGRIDRPPRRCVGAPPSP